MGATRRVDDGRGGVQAGASAALRDRHAGRASIVLAAGGLSALALTWAAWVVMGDAEQAAGQATQRLVGEVSDAVADELRRWGRDAGAIPDDFGQDERLSWSAASQPLLLEPGPGLEWHNAGDGPVSACDTLLAEAARQELAGDKDEAVLQLVLDAVEVAGDPRCEAEARLRAIQLALRTQRRDVALAQWNGARDGLDGSLTRDGTSTLLLCALAAAPLLEQDERQRAWVHLSTRWLAGELRLAGAATTLRVVGERLILTEGALRRRERLVALVTDAAEPAGGDQLVSAFLQ
jgi:hypothetical protein